MYSETVQALSEQAVVKLNEQKRSLLGHLVRSMAAGMYVGGAIVLIFTIGGAASGGGAFQGRIDEVAVYDVAMAAEQIRDHFLANTVTRPSRAASAISVP